MFINRETLNDDIVTVYNVYVEKSLIMIYEIKLSYNKNTNNYFRIEYPITGVDSINVYYDNKYEYKDIYNTYDEAVSRKLELEKIVNSYLDKLKQKDKEFIDSSFELMRSIINGNIDSDNLKYEQFLLLEVLAEYSRSKL